MIKVRQATVIHKPAAEVFAFVTDVSQFNEWMSGAVGYKAISQGPLGVGATFRQTGEFMGKRFEMDIIVTHFEQDRRFSFKSASGPVPFEQHYRFEAEGDATRLTVVVVGEMKGFLSMLSGVAERVYRLQLEGDLERLEQILAQQDGGEGNPP